MITVSRLTVRGSFLLLIGVLAVGFVLLGTVSVGTLNRLKVNGPVYQRIVQGKDIVADILPPPEYIIESYLVALQLLDAPSPERAGLAKDLAKLRADYRDRHEYWQKQNLEPELQSMLLEKSATEADRFFALAFGDFLPAIESGDAARARDTMTAMKRHYAAHRQAIDEVVTYTNKRNESDEALAAEEIESAQTLMIAVFIASMAAAIGLAMAISRGLWARLGGEPSDAAATAHRIAAGDLSGTIRLGAGDDSSIMAALHRMQEQLRVPLQGILDSAQLLATSSAELAAESRQLMEAASAQSDRSQSMAAAVEEISTSVATMTGNAADARRLADAAAPTAAEGSAQVVLTAAKLSEITGAVQAAMTTLDALNEHTAGISTIVAEIKGIAEQTNLLALNAAIEAARAGEHGRGFAVVADEVRKLAERTSHSTEEIVQMVSQIQLGTEAAVRGMHEGAAKVELGVDHARRTGESIDSVRGTAADVAGAVADISSGLAEENSAGQHLANDAEAIASSAEQNRQAAVAVGGTVDRLARVAESLREAVGRFRL